MPKRFTGDELNSKDVSEHPQGIFTGDVILSDEDLEDNERVYNPKPFRNIILHDYVYPGKADTRMGSRSEMIIEAVIRKCPAGYCVYTENKKRLLGKHPTKEKAIKQLQAIEINKNK
jgi:hypothetical protein